MPRPKQQARELRRAASEQATRDVLQAISDLRRNGPPIEAYREQVARCYRWVEHAARGRPANALLRAHGGTALPAELFNEMPLCPCGCGSRGHLTKAL